MQRLYSAVLVLPYQDSKISIRQYLGTDGKTAHHSCQPEELKMREIFYFLFTLKYLMTNTLPDENKCPSYNGDCLLEVIFNKNPPLIH